MRLNLGSGAYSLPRADGWENWDADPGTPADRHQYVPPIPLPDASVAEIYAGHLLEHLEPHEGDFLLRECYRCLVPGGRLGVVVPDTRWVLDCYLSRTGRWVEVPEGRHWCLDDLDSVCSVFLFSTIQDSRHKWAYDEDTLPAALERAGFTVGGRIDPWRDPRHSVGARWNLGYDGVKRARAEAAA